MLGLKIFKYLNIKYENQCMDDDKKQGIRINYYVSLYNIITIIIVLLLYCIYKINTTLLHHILWECTLIIVVIVLVS